MLINNKITIISFVAFVIIAGCLLIATRDISAPQQKTEKVLANEKFFK